MQTRLSLALFVAALLAASDLIPSATAQSVVRFETSVGSFDMVLNPTNNPRLQEHVDNMLRYVKEDKYRGSWINRAAQTQSGGDFVLQMGGFYTHTKRVPMTIDSTRPVFPFDPVEGEPASEISNLSNTVGTVSLALPGDGMGGTNQDAGTSSFFVNLTDNSFLDADFTVFAAISDMTTINEIMDLMQVDLTADEDFGAGSGNLGFSDVPLDENNFQVFIRRAFQITDTLAVASAIAGVEDAMAASLAGGGTGGSAASAPITASVVPEPSTCTMLLAGLAALGMRRRRRG